MPTGSDAVTRIYLRWRDIDSLGHLNHSVYHDFLAEGRFAVIRAHTGDTEFNFVLVHVELDYRREVRREEGHVDVTGEIVRVGGKSITLEQQIVLPAGSVAAESRSVVVAWDPVKRGARELSLQERAALEQLPAPS